MLHQNDHQRWYFMKSPDILENPFSGFNFQLSVIPHRASKISNKNLQHSSNTLPLKLSPSPSFHLLLAQFIFTCSHGNTTSGKQNKIFPVKSHKMTLFFDTKVQFLDAETISTIVVFHPNEPLFAVAGFGENRGGSVTIFDDTVRKKCFWCLALI